MELQQVALEIVKKHGKAMALEMIAELAIPALEEAAKKSATPIDDLVVAALKNPLKEALLEMIEKI
jgi:hypothetical protein